MRLRRSHVHRPGAVSPSRGLIRLRHQRCQTSAAARQRQARAVRRAGGGNHRGRVAISELGRFAPQTCLSRCKEERVMPEFDNYWQRSVGRRAALRLAAAGSASAALNLAGCGGSASNASKTARSGASSQTAPTSVVAEAATSAATAAKATPATLDSTKGKPGGNFTFQGAGSAGTMVLINTNDDGFTHSGMLIPRNGRPGVDPLDIGAEPDLATAMPEQPDQLTFRFTLRPAKFHNGTPVTSADV